MKVVIDIPDAMYENAVNDLMCGSFADRIKNGQVLPKGHGRLIDADALKEIIGQFPLTWEYGQGVNDCWDALIAAPTIIEADKEV